MSTEALEALERLIGAASETEGCWSNVEREEFRADAATIKAALSRLTSEVETGTVGDVAIAMNEMAGSMRSVAKDRGKVEFSLINSWSAEIDKYAARIRATPSSEPPADKQEKE